MAHDDNDQDHRFKIVVVGRRYTAAYKQQERKREQQERRARIDQEAPVCRAYAATGECRYGARCRYSHDAARAADLTAAIDAASTQLCPSIERGEECRFGERCWYIHDNDDDSANH